MYKKIVLMLSAIIIFSLPFQQQYAESAILSKVASKGAQKIVKEVIKESAFDIAVDLFVNEAYRMASEEQAKYQAQQDYELFCGKKMPDLITCEKPMQVKKVLTETDKVNIGNQAEIELDKLITNGKGFTRWQKFLDWFLPIWVASFALTAITYAIDPEVRSLFNEAGYNALVALGIIKPVTSTEKNEMQPIDPTASTTPDVTQPRFLKKSNAGGDTVTVSFPGTYSFEQNMEFQTQWEVLFSPNNRNLTSYNIRMGIPNSGGNSQELFSIGVGVKTDVVVYKTVLGTPISVTVSKNGQITETSTAWDVGNQYPNPATPLISLSNQNIDIKKATSIRTRTPYQIGDYWYTDSLFNTVSGDQYELQIKSTNFHSKPINGFSTYVQTARTDSTSTSVKQTTTILYDQPIYKEILTGTYAEVESEIDPIATSKYHKDGNVALIPPSALPYTQTSTGLQLTPEIDETTGEQKFTTPTGESVPEDDITVGEPNVQENPSPEPNTVTPPATQTNPNPEPIPLTPSTPTQPPPPPPTPVETLPPVFPEGESCDVGLKLPRFMPLLNTISEAFPFSIPFDLKDGFDAIFAEMGSEKPEFNYKFDFMGKEQSWKITIPDYFDDWKVFTDSFLIFIFDVGIIYAIYRFMGGGS